MKMRRFEKQFVNSSNHSRRVADHAVQLLTAANPQPGLRLLDVGCGNGAAAIHVARALRLAVIGVDVDPEQIEAAVAAGRGLADVRFLVADATKLPFADGEFDLVYTNKTTHHIGDWQRALTEMIRVLKPDGYLLYSDFVAPLGQRLPTRHALDSFVAQHRLESVRRSGAPFRYTGVFRKANADAATLGVSRPTGVRTGQAARSGASPSATRTRPPATTVSYADQTARDHRQLADAIASGAVETSIEE